MFTAHTKTKQNLLLAKVGNALRSLKENKSARSNAVTTGMNGVLKEAETDLRRVFEIKYDKLKTTHMRELR